MTDPRIVHAEQLTTIANDIEICNPGDGSGTLVGVAMEGTDPSQQGQVVIYEAFDGIGLNPIIKVNGKLYFLK